MLRLFYICAVCVIALSACGLRPLYKAPGGPQQVKAVYNQVTIQPIQNRNGQKLRFELQNRFGTPDVGSRYVLETNLGLSTRSLGIQSDSSATRAQVISTATIYLRDKINDKIVLKRTVRSTGDYNILSSQYSTTATQMDAIDRSLNDLANQIYIMLGMYFENPDLMGMQDIDFDEDSGQQKIDDIDNKFDKLYETENQSDTSFY